MSPKEGFPFFSTDAGNVQKPKTQEKQGDALAELRAHDEKLADKYEKNFKPTEIEDIDQFLNQNGETWASVAIADSREDLESALHTYINLKKNGEDKTEIKSTIIGLLA